MNIWNSRKHPPLQTQANFPHFWHTPTHWMAAHALITKSRCFFKTPIYKVEGIQSDSVPVIIVTPQSVQKTFLLLLLFGWTVSSLRLDWVLSPIVLMNRLCAWPVINSSRTTDRDSKSILIALFKSPLNRLHLMVLNSGASGHCSRIGFWMFWSA